MHRGKGTYVRVAVALVAVVLSNRAQAGGLILYEIGSPDLGLAAAGYAARAQDAATVLTNPAGMTRLQQSQFMLSGQALYAAVQFSPNSLTTPSLGTNGGGNAIGFLPGGSAFFVWSATPDLKVGFGLFSNFGLSESYDDAWVGRYYVQSATLVGLSLMPSVAYRFAPWFSAGASVNIMYGILRDRAAVSGTLPTSPDGTLKVESNAWGVGAEVGVLFEPAEGTRIGATYTSPMSLGFNATPSITNVPPNSPLLALQKPLSLGMTVPQGVMLSVYQEVVPGLALLANVGWQNWSQFGKVDVQISDPAQTSVTANVNYSDTWHGALGAQIKVAEGWLVSTGVSYDSSMVANAERTPALPTGPAWRFAGGVQHPVSEHVELGVAYEFLWSGTLPMDQERGPMSGRVAGSYQNTLLNFFAFNVNWRL
jgi:long-chain fatty acid transport protein